VTTTPYARDLAWLAAHREHLDLYDQALIDVAWADVTLGRVASLPTALEDLAADTLRGARSVVTDGNDPSKRLQRVRDLYRLATLVRDEPDASS